MIRILQGRGRWLFIVGVLAGVIVVLGVAVSRMNTPPIKRMTVNIGNAPPIMAEVADTERLRANGLSGRQSLAEKAGMLFIFPVPGYHAFWMKDMKFALDLLWIQNGRVVGVTSNAPPEGASPTHVYTPPEPVEFVLEVNAGFTAAYGITVGDEVALRGL